MYKKIYRSMCLLSMATLIIAAVMILLVCYTTFNNKFKSEMRNETIMLADFINSNGGSINKDAFSDYDDRRITLISKDGKVIFDNDVDIGSLDNHNNRPEVAAARKSGRGESERYSITNAKKVYYFAARLKDGTILRIATASSNIMQMFFSAIIAVLFIAALIYLLCIIVATRLTSNIIKPIEMASFESETEVYDEIKPFLNRIAGQNQEIKRQMNKVKAHKVRLQAITDNMNEGIVIIDKDSNVLEINSCACSIFGTTESVKNKAFSALTDKPELKNALEKALSGEKDNVYIELNSKTYQIFYSPVYENNDISGVVMLLFDVSDRAEAEQIRREFTANVSHELKTPLTSIHGYAQVIDKGIAKPEDIQRFASKIEKESSRLITLIDDIIELSNLDENTAGYEKQEFSLGRVVSDVTETLQSKADERNITIIKYGDSMVYGNLSQITELVYNLVDNAIKYNKAGGSIVIKIKENKLYVSDTGIGIPPEYIDRIFERFFRVDKSHSKKVNGTGLGLSIVKHIAIANNAEIEVKSKSGAGTTFTVTFRKDD